MANNVFANGREIACKKGSGKSICAFPDVVWTPPDKVPPTPTGVPVPYPNTAMASDTSKGTKKVKVSGKETMLKNSSNFKKSMGDEAGVAQLKGFMTMKNGGKVFFAMWSMDVKFEGKNVVRHLDIATHNHGSQVGNTPPWPFMDKMAIDSKGKSKDPCQKDKENEKNACSELEKNGVDICKEAGLDGKKYMSNDAAKADGYTGVADWKKQISQAAAADNDAAKCVRAKKCKLSPYKPGACCPAQTADHVLPKSSFYQTNVKSGTKVAGWAPGDPAGTPPAGYDPNKAPCMCLEGSSNVGGSHGLRHSIHKLKGKNDGVKAGALVDFDTEVTRSASSASEVTKDPTCKTECIEAQIKEGHKGMGSGQIRHKPCGSKMDQAQIDNKLTNFALAAMTP